MLRSRKAAPIAPPARPAQDREVAASWAATAVIPTKASADPAQPAANAKDPEFGIPRPI